jgi:hypothetical protein
MLSNVRRHRAVEQKGADMSVTDLCLILGMLFAFATLVVKIIEVSRRN